jgi:hypothetical protein
MGETGEVMHQGQGEIMAAEVTCQPLLFWRRSPPARNMERMSTATFSQGSPSVLGLELDLVCGEAWLDNAVEKREGKERWEVVDCEARAHLKLRADATVTTAGGLGGGGAPEASLHQCTMEREVASGDGHGGPAAARQRKRRRRGWAPHSRGFAWILDHSDLRDNGPDPRQPRSNSWCCELHGSNGSRINGRRGPATSAGNEPRFRLVKIHANENFLSGPMTSSVRPEPNPSFGPVWCNLSGPTRVFFLLNRHFDSNKALPQLSICQFNLSTLVLVQTNPFTYIWLHISMKLIYFFYFWIFSLFIL